MTTSLHFPRLTILGLGLIGGSVARAARAHGLAEHITAFDSNPEHLAQALADGAIDSAAATVEDAVKNADAVVLAAPVGIIVSMVPQIAPHVKKNAFVTDTGSVKTAIHDAMNEYFGPAIRFVPAHPVAGREKSGYGAGAAEIFAGRRVVLCPPMHAKPGTLSVAEDFWRGLGGVVEVIPPNLHDMIYAHTSHLPHLLAYAEITALPVMPPELVAHLRIAKASPALWADICMLNRGYVIPALDAYLAIIRHMADELSTGAPAPLAAADPTAMAGLFARLASACLISTLTLAEQKHDIKLARYAGTGFADYVTPTMSEPEGDMEKISALYPHLLPILRQFITALSGMRQYLAEGNQQGLVKKMR